MVIVTSMEWSIPVPAMSVTIAPLKLLGQWNLTRSLYRPILSPSKLNCLLHRNIISFLLLDIQIFLGEDHLDLLINNAGIMCHPQAKTEDGLEYHFGVNYLGESALAELNSLKVCKFRFKVL